MDNRDFLANIEFSLNWKTEYSTHAETYYGLNVNFWRDCFPSELHKNLMQAGPNDRIEWTPPGNGMVEAYQEKKIFSVKPSQFSGLGRSETAIIPRKGRYYPKGLLKGIAHVFPENVEPFRLADVSDDRLVVDFNHPLAGKELAVSLRIRDMWRKDREKGGACYDWVETITTGPGMQARIHGEPTDFQADNGYSRQDETPDAGFYQEPRMVHHVDETARSVIRNLYSQELKPGMKVLDLMASWESHIDRELGIGSLSGVGLNQKELSSNPQLSDYHVLDLNQTVSLPFEADSFDAVVCTNSVEYLTDPMRIFRMVADVLRPGGIFMVTFSNRWFPPKVTRLWTELHEFERMGLVSEYFLQSGRFKGLQTYSMRGLPRPVDDKYYPEFRLSDPVYAVWARKE